MAKLPRVARQRRPAPLAGSKPIPPVGAAPRGKRVGRSGRRSPVAKPADTNLADAIQATGDGYPTNLAPSTTVELARPNRARGNSLIPVR